MSKSTNLMQAATLPGDSTIVLGEFTPLTSLPTGSPLDQVSDAYSLMASGNCGKVAVVFDEEAEPCQCSH